MNIQKTLIAFGFAFFGLGVVTALAAGGGGSGGSSGGGSSGGGSSGGGSTSNALINVACVKSPLGGYSTPGGTSNLYTINNGCSFSINVTYAFAYNNAQTCTDRRVAARVTPGRNPASSASFIAEFNNITGICWYQAE